MSQHIFFCHKCKIYTMENKCPTCLNKTFTTKPAKFNIEDKWGKYRREAKKSRGNC